MLHDRDAPSWHKKLHKSNYFGTLYYRPVPQGLPPPVDTLAADKPQHSAGARVSPGSTTARHGIHDRLLAAIGSGHIGSVRGACAAHWSTVVNIMLAQTAVRQFVLVNETHPGGRPHELQQPLLHPQQLVSFITAATRSWYLTAVAQQPITCGKATGASACSLDKASEYAAISPFSSVICC